jgi:hypothetical protein
MEDFPPSMHFHWGWVVKRIVCLLAAVSFLFLAAVLPAQEEVADQSARYHLIQVVDSSFLEKVNDSARQGYRLIATTAVPGSLVAIMERVEDPPAHFDYVMVPVRATKTFETAGKTKAEAANQLNAAGEKGYRLRVTLGNMAVMESQSNSGQHYQYALSSPGSFGYFKKDEISSLVVAGYHWAATANVILIFERAAESGNAHPGLGPGSQPVPYKRFIFPENNIVRSNLPEKQLHKLASQGARVLDFFGSPVQMILAMEETVPPSPPYQYIVLKPRNENSPLALRAKMSKVEAADLTRAGQQGFRLLPLSTPAPPFVMEKAPGATKRYEYQFITATRLAELAEQLNGTGRNRFHVAKLTASEEGFLVVLEKPDAE